VLHSQIYSRMCLAAEETVEVDMFRVCMVTPNSDHKGVISLFLAVETNVVVCRPVVCSSVGLVVLAH
jgi:hypothetical protein